MDKRFEKCFTKEHMGAANELRKRYRIISQRNAKEHHKEMHHIPTLKSGRPAVPGAGNDV